jgi:hypothetical protein
MRVIELDASTWKTPLDFMRALKTAIGAPEWHGSNLNAFIDSMIWGGINSLEPPYTVIITKTGDVPSNVADAIRVLSTALSEQREWKLSHRGEDVDVSLKVQNALGWYVRVTTAQIVDGESLTVLYVVGNPSPEQAEQAVRQARSLPGEKYAAVAEATVGRGPQPEPGQVWELKGAI